MSCPFWFEKIIAFPFIWCEKNIIFCQLKLIVDLKKSNFKNQILDVIWEKKAFDHLKRLKKFQH